jgi:hypothetical protein
MSPLPPDAWNARAVHHLMLRAGFGVSPEEAVALAKRTPEAVVDGLLDVAGPSARDEAPDWFKAADADERFQVKLRRLRREGVPEESLGELQNEEQRRNRRAMVESRRWWLARMVEGPNPLREKLALCWHGHFACSVQKVRAAWPMLAQNLMFREASAGTWRDMLLRVSQDPAMLVYLDNAISNQRGPNENYARELMELFSLGEGHYGEDDVRAAARAFTGWTLAPNRWAFAEKSFLHDKGFKTFLGTSGNLDGRDVIAALVAHPQAAPFLVEKLWRFFAGGRADLRRDGRPERRLPRGGFFLAGPPPSPLPAPGFLRAGAPPLDDQGSGAVHGPSLARLRRQDALGRHAAEGLRATGPRAFRPALGQGLGRRRGLDHRLQPGATLSNHRSLAARRKRQRPRARRGRDLRPEPFAARRVAFARGRPRAAFRVPLPRSAARGRPRGGRPRARAPSAARRVDAEGLAGHPLRPHPNPAIPTHLSRDLPCKVPS